MKKYDPNKAPDAEEWLGMDEALRIELVGSYHRRAGVRLPNARLHATFHVIVENQLAMPEAVVVETLERLQREGLSRHDAIHAMGSVLAEQLYGAVKEPSAAGGADPNAVYAEGLKKLTAEGWRNSGSE